MSQFWRFLLGSAAGLTVDLVGFFLLTHLGMPPAAANATSATCSITVVYLLVSRYTFDRSATIATYVLFFMWYATSIAFFSFAIEVISTALPAEPGLVKVASVPVSFILNFAFSKVLFGRRRTED
ncbi:GtrA family protein [Microcella alkalica]|uniref:GtrA family protein n=1 Tax=Microcella alkalica TaxID=355930 RepID=UPI0015FB4B50